MAQTPALNIQFDGRTIGHGPPDPSIAVGLESVVTIENTILKWYSRDGTQQGSVAVGGDPRLVYDDANDRFVFAALGNGTGLNGNVPIAVSKTGNPNDGWYFGSINANLSDTEHLDYPSIATDGKAVYLQAALYNGDTFEGTRLWITENGLGSGGLYTGGSFNSIEYSAAQTGTALIGEPAQILGPMTGSPRAFFYNGAHFTGNGAGESISVTEIVNPTTSPTFVQHSIGFTAAASSVFNAPSQPGTSQTIEVDGTNSVWRDGYLYVVEIYRPASGPDANVATTHWFKINTGNWSLADQGDVSGAALGSGVATFDPTISVNNNGDFAINFTASGPGLYAGSYYVLHRASDAAGTLETPQALHVGLDAYVSLEGPRNRWGDYERTIVVDPADGNSFWMFNEYAYTRGQDGNGRYATVIGAFSATGGGVPTDGNDNLVGTASNDTLRGLLGNDTIRGLAGNDTIDGGPGFDSAVFSGPRSAYTLTAPNSNTLRVVGPDGTDTLTNVERLVFDDGVVLFGSTGNDNLVGGAGNDILISGADIITPILGNLPDQAGQMGPEWHVASAQDFTGDGKGDIMWVRNTTGDATLWTMNNGTLSSFSATQGHMGPEWTAAGSGDFNRDGKADLVWTHSGDVALWLMNGPNLAGFAAPTGHMGPEWKLQGIGDFNNDGFSDLVWHSSNADVAIWSMSGTSLGGYGVSNGHIGAEWNVRAVADLNGDGRDEILWVSDTGDIQTWSMFGSNVTGTTNTGHMGTEWHVGGAGDFNMDGKTDLVWVSDNNDVQIWEMNGGSIAQIITPAGHMGPEWKLQGVSDFSGDGRPDLLWVTAAGKTAVWNMVGNGDVMTGGAGSDTFQFNALNETGKVITDFQPGAGGDILDLRNLEQPTGYTGNDGLRDGEVRLIQNGANIEVQVDSHFGEHHFVDAVTLQNVNAAALIHGNFLV